MKSFLFRLYLSWMKFLARLREINPKQMVILNGAGRSGSNGYVFYKYMRQNHPDYQVTLVEPWPSSHLTWATWKKIGCAHYLLTTHQPFKVRRGQISVQLWHGIPLKRMGWLAHNTRSQDNHRNQRLWAHQTDIITSSSALYESLMSACIAIPNAKFHRLGFPRLDALPRPKKTKPELLEELFHCQDPSAQLGIYLPTFRYELKNKAVMQKIKEGNFFAFADFDGAELNQTLKDHHQYLLVKLHPYEMRLFAHLKSNYSNITFLNNDYLFKQKCDLYELLGSTDFLMTDFSSVYFDYLNLNKPIIFITNFLAEYEKKRGLLLGPYKAITPGLCVASQAQLINQLGQLDNTKARRRRFYWRKLINQIPAGQACDRLFAYLTKQV